MATPFAELDGVKQLEAARSAVQDGARSLESAPKRRVAIVGTPNCGKSLIFHRLTGVFSASANYPYTTLQLEEKPFRKDGREYICIDTPAISGLESMAEEEAPTRELLETRPPDIILQCMDAGHLERSLMLTAQLADLEIPMAACLNMFDEATNRGIFVDVEKLSQRLGIPMSAACALDGRGIQNIAADLSRARRPKQAPYSDCLQTMLGTRGSRDSRARRLAALLDQEHSHLEAGRNFRHMALENQRLWAKRIASDVIKDIGLEPVGSYWDTLAKFALHPVGAWLALLMVIPLLYCLVAELGAKILAGEINRLCVVPAVAFISSLTGRGILHEILVGEFGLLSLGLFNAVGTVLPILTVFYLFFGLLEDVGYFPLLSVQFDRLLRFVGLNGKSVLPIALGFGCNAVASMAIRGLETRRQRFIAAFLISLGIPCACQLGVIIAVLVAFPYAAVIGIISMVVLIEVAAGTVLARILPDRSRHGEFLVELPPLRAPRWGNILSKTYRRVREFIAEAVPMFVAGAGLLLLLRFAGLLDRIRDVVAPLIVGGLGLPRAFVDALLIALARRELGALMLKDMMQQAPLSLKQTFVGLLVLILFVPCVTTSMILWRTLGWRGAAVIFTAVIGVAIGIGSLVNLVWL